jgi:hypothetical protein
MDGPLAYLSPRRTWQRYRLMADLGSLVNTGFYSNTGWLSDDGEIEFATDDDNDADSVHGPCRNSHSASLKRVARNLFSMENTLEYFAGITIFSHHPRTLRNCGTQSVHSSCLPLAAAFLRLRNPGLQL